MKLVKVKEMPSRINHDLQGYIATFMKMDTQIVQVELAPGEYANMKSAQSCILSAINRAKVPVKTSVCDGKLYLIRTDM